MSSVLSSPTLSVPTVTIETSPSASELKVRVGRARSSSLVKVETVGEDSQEEGLDQSVYGNVNAEWVNRKGQSTAVLYKAPPSSSLTVMATTGAWVIHPVLIIAGKIVIDTIPGMTQELSWTLVNLIYLGVRSALLSR